MAEEQDQDDKTEDPTARRMEKARGRRSGVAIRKTPALRRLLWGLLRRCITAAFGLRQSFWSCSRVR